MNGSRGRGLQGGLRAGAGAWASFGEGTEVGRDTLTDFQPHQTPVRSIPSHGLQRGRR